MMILQYCLNISSSGGQLDFLGFLVVKLLNPSNLIHTNQICIAVIQSSPKYLSDLNTARFQLDCHISDKV